MKTVIAAALAALAIPVALKAQSKTGAELLLEAVRTGISCTQEDSLTHRRYRVGRDLEFELSGVGDRDGSVGLAVTRASADADYQLLITVGSPCIGVMEGVGTFAKRRSEGVPGAIARVLVSSVTGRVYLDARSCLAAR